MIDDKRFFEIKARHEAGEYLAQQDINFLISELGLRLEKVIKQRKKNLDNYYERKEERQAAQKKYRQTHKAEMLEAKKKWEAAHPEKVKERQHRNYLKNREKILARHKAKMAENKARCEREKGNTLCPT